MVFFTNSWGNTGILYAVKRHTRFDVRTQKYCDDFWVLDVVIINTHWIQKRRYTVGLQWGRMCGYHRVSGHSSPIYIPKGKRGTPHMVHWGNYRGMITGGSAERCVGGLSNIQKLQLATDFCAKRQTDVPAWLADEFCHWVA
jgi:hypothetical protein